MRFYYLLLIALLQMPATFAQQKVIDSLENQLKQSIPDTIRIVSMMRLAIQYEAVDTARAAALYNQGIALANKIGNNYLASRHYHNRAILETTVGKYNQADISIDSGIWYLDHSRHPDAEFRKASLYSEKANLNRYTNNFKKSIEWQLKAIAVFERLKKYPNLLNSYLNLSGFFKEQNDYDKQLLYSRKAYETSLKAGDTLSLFKGNTFMMFGLVNQQQYDSGYYFLNQARHYYSPYHPQDVLVSFHLVAGLAYMNLKKLDSARLEFEQSLAIAERNNAIFSIIQSRIQIAWVYAQQKQFAKAEPMLLEAYRQADSMHQSSQLVIALEYLGKLYEAKGEYKKAVGYYKDWKILSDSIASETNKKYANNLEVLYETSKKEDQIRQLESDKKIQQLTIKEKNTFNYILIGGAAALLIFSFLSFRNYRHKQKLQQQRISELETEKQLTATEAVLKGEEQERTRLAKDLHDGLGGMLSGIKYSLNTMKGNLIMTPDNAQAFERSMDMLDSSIKEMRRVAHNMMPEALVKFGLDTALKDFCTDINNSGALKVTYQSIGLEGVVIDQTVAITIYRIVQELLNNTIKHAQASEAIVQITKDGPGLSVTVEDNGKGFDTTILSNSRGIGWTNILNRIEFLKGKLDIQSSAQSGTSVHIEMES